MNALVEAIEDCIPGAGAVQALPMNLKGANWNLRIVGDQAGPFAVANYRNL